MGASWPVQARPSLITVASLIALYRTDQLRGHIRRALDNGVTKEGDRRSLIAHMAFYGGWPTAANAVQVAKQVLKACKEGGQWKRQPFSSAPLVRELCGVTTVGETWQRIGIYQGMHSDAMVRMLAPPARPEVVYAGTDKGLYCSDDTGASWKQMDSPLNPYAVWPLRLIPSTQKFSLPGPAPCPSKVFRSTDGGKSWEEKPAAIADECPNVGIPRVTGIAIDPVNRHNIWVGIEVDGLRWQYRLWRDLEDHQRYGDPQP